MVCGKLQRMWSILILSLYFQGIRCGKIKKPKLPFITCRQTEITRKKQKKIASDGRIWYNVGIHPADAAD
jgi:hypothetical protein